MGSVDREARIATLEEKVAKIDELDVRIRNLESHTQRLVAAVEQMSEYMLMIVQKRP